MAVLQPLGLNITEEIQDRLISLKLFSMNQDFGG